MTVSRSSDRQRIFIAGRLTFGGGVMSVPCNVRDLSDHGARVTLDASTTLPTHMTLDIPARGVTRQVEMRWRHGEVVGLEFTTKEEAASAADDPFSRLRQLEEENAKLRKQVRALRLEIANRLARDEASN